MHFAMVNGVSETHGNKLDCAALGFENPNDYETKCSQQCPAYRAVHKELPGESPLHLSAYPANPSDRDLRQIVLVALYDYHARHPDRFGQFDITLQYLKYSLSRLAPDMNEATLLRVIMPMEAREEVRTLQENADQVPRWICITVQGIEAITSEVLFENRNVGVKIMGDHVEVNGNGNQVVNKSKYVSQSQVSEKYGPDLSEKLSELKAAIGVSELPTDDQLDALAEVEAVEAELRKPEVEERAIQRPIRNIFRIMERNPAVTSALMTTLSTVALMVQVNLMG